DPTEGARVAPRLGDVSARLRPRCPCRVAPGRDRRGVLRGDRAELGGGADQLGGAGGGSRSPARPRPRADLAHTSRRSRDRASLRRTAFSLPPRTRGGPAPPPRPTPRVRPPAAGRPLPR